MLAKKKVVSAVNRAEQHARIISNVTALKNKNLIRLQENTIFLYPDLWKDKKAACNWIDCLLVYYRLKRKFKTGNLYFKHIETEELIGTCIDTKAKILIELS
ncbi:hypothetical protein D9M68_397110 [compost metagenome]